MSGFSAAWLALREPADHRARHAALEEEVAAALRHHPVQRIVDLGAGTGSNLRALAPRLGARQDWLLVDHDPALAAAARTALSAFADQAADAGDHLALRLGRRRITVRFAAADLSADLSAIAAFSPHLVTTAAFFDLVSATWCHRFAAAVAPTGAVIHAALTCDGRDHWTPPHPADAAVAAAFRADQGRDKGFGPAAGPDATDRLAAALRRAGYRVATADSPWRLAAGDRALIAALAEGTAQAAAQTKRVAPDLLAGWRTARTTATGCVIGHQDLLALPPGADAPRPG